MIQSKIDNGLVVLGLKRKEKFDEDWALDIGTAINRNQEEVKLSSSSPHVIFICGARGSGKSYTLGVLAEEIAQSDSDLAAVIIDPIGVFWSMKYPNQEEGEVEALRKMGMEPRGIENLSVFVPTGYKSEIPEETYDTDFSFKPSALKVEDWCLTFGIDRYSPQGLLLERTIEKVKSGYTRRLGDRVEGGSRNVSPTEEFSIDDMLECINHDREFLSKEKGFKGSTRRALNSRLRAAKDWGIFGREKGLSDLIVPGKISVVDISFLSTNIGALVLGILGRKILAARKAAAREEAVHDLEDEGEASSGKLPPTWLMVDEAHNFAPATGKTAATDPLVEYVKQGRRPGLSAVLSTQQPSALSSKMISQLDILISHRLSFEGDIKEVRKRMPTALPEDLKDPSSLKKLAEGTAIAADKEISRAFVTSIRPRFSQHEGRERVTKASQEGSDYQTKEREVEAQIESSEGYAKEEEVLTVPFLIELESALEILESNRRQFLKVLWSVEKVKEVHKRYYPLWSVLLDYYPKEGKAMNLRVQIDGLTGELVRKVEGKLLRTSGVRILPDLKSSEREVFFEILRSKPVEYNDLERGGGSVKSAVKALIERALIREFDKGGKKLLDTSKNTDVPVSLSERSLLTSEDMPEPESKLVLPEEKIERVVSEDQMLEILGSFGDMEIIERDLLYYPYWVGELMGDEGSRIVSIDGVSGQRDGYAERMLRRRI